MNAAKAKVWTERGYPPPPVRAGCEDWNWGEQQFLTRGAIVSVWIAREGEGVDSPVHNHLTIHHGGKLLHEEYLGIRAGVAVNRAYRIGRALQAGRPESVGITTMTSDMVGVVQ